MNNILITTSSFGEELLATIENQGLKVILNPFKRKLSEEEVGKLLENYKPVGMIAGVESITRAAMEKSPSLKVISRCGIGMDSVDLVAARDLGVQVTNTPDAPTIPVAELTLGLILSLLRSLHISDASIRNGKWERPMGELLYGKKVGIIGCGRIGSYVAKMCMAFGSHVIGYDPNCNFHQYVELTSLEKLLNDSDIVTLHLPFMETNRHIINSERIALMKSGAVLINASRGGLVDEQALAEALQYGKLSGAAIDCFEQEPYSGPLVQLKNTHLTGHIGSYAREGRMIMEQQAMENLLKVLRDVQLIGEVVA